MFRRKASPDKALSVARMTILAADCQDSGIGIVIARRPFTLLVPSHLIELINDGQSQSISVNGIVYEDAKVLPTPALQRDHLSVLQFRKQRSRELASAHLPRRNVDLRPGQSISLQHLESRPNSTGTIIDVRERGDGRSVITDIEVAAGDSGSPLLVSGQLVAVCQGMIQSGGPATAVAVPLSQDSFLELRKLRRRYRTTVSSALISSLLAVVLSFAGFAIYSANSFTLEAIDVPEDGGMVTATNAQTLTLKPSWSRTFDTPIRSSLALASTVDGALDRVAIGTLCHEGINGAICLLDSKGDSLWSYSIPDGECIYSTETESYNGFLADRIYTGDLDQDGRTELLVVFVHDHFYPCKLIVFSMAGEILAEFWHPGYIRTIVTGKVGSSDDVFVIVSASNSALKHTYWNPQTLFAFRGLDISGQAPPYTGSSGRLDALEPSHELWTWVIVNIDPETMRAKCADFNLVDLDGDGLNEIQAPLSDGRFYNFNEYGDVIGTQLGDRFVQSFPDTPPPPLVELWEYLDRIDAT
ncbi:hypothetical protein IH601_07335 [Candidatus Bipolaricaulota bacterium]|nr:hypothetical protein [Candidatus Bipolaricaulota bacterium]